MPRALKFAISSLLIGLMSVGLAYAGAIISPPKLTGAEASISEDGEPTPEATSTPEDSTTPRTLGAGQIWAGAAKTSMEPTPDADQGEVWQKDPGVCKTLSEEEPEAFIGSIENAGDTRIKWAEGSNCIYMGGYGIGPMNPITKWDDQDGLWVRSVAMKDKEGKALVITLVDAVYWEAYYNSMCTGCGFMEIADTLAQSTGLTADQFMFASSHSHTSPDFIGGWGGVPTWYMDQITTAIKETATDALDSVRPATLEVGEEMARQFNGERRDAYRSAEDDTLSWLRLVEANADGTAGATVATLGAYGAHPVTANEDSGVANADFPGTFAKKVEERFGGLGMFLQTGLGNISPRGSTEEMGFGLADLIPAVGTGQRITNTSITTKRAFWAQPATNVPLGSLGAAGFFDRKFNQAPASVSEGKSDRPNKKCNSSSPLSVNTSVSAAKIGSLWITGGPGELFSSATNTLEGQNPTGVTFALALVNDGLGYLVPSIETDHVARQGVGFVAGEAPPPVGVSEYEDAYSIDACFGDAALEKTIALLRTI